MMIILKKVTVIALMLLGLGIYAQENRDLDNYRYTDKRGVIIATNTEDDIVNKESEIIKLS